MNLWDKATLAVLWASVGTNHVYNGHLWMGLLGLGMCAFNAGIIGFELAKRNRVN
jgi:hypothetical protein